MNTFFKLGTVALAALGLYACGEESAATNCPPNQSVSCNCPGTNVPGAQTCLPDGSGFDKCLCEATTTSGGGAPSTTGPTTTGPTSGPSSSSTGFPSGPSSGSAGGADPNNGVCDTGASCGECQASECALDICSKSKAACDKNPECKALFDCTSGCDTMDQQCMNGCITKHMAGTQDLISFITCTACDPGPCASDCKGFLQCSMN